jgi:hypothetical protein
LQFNPNPVNHRREPGLASPDVAQKVHSSAQRKTSEQMEILKGMRNVIAIPIQDEKQENRTTSNREWAQLRRRRHPCGAKVF